MRVALEKPYGPTTAFAMLVLMFVLMFVRTIATDTPHGCQAVVISPAALEHLPSWAWVQVRAWVAAQPGSSSSGSERCSGPSRLGSAAHADAMEEHRAFTWWIRAARVEMRSQTCLCMPVFCFIYNDKGGRAVVVVAGAMQV